MKKKDSDLRPHAVTDARSAGDEARSAGDDARKRILARRASFVAAALAGVSSACGKEPNQPPQPCLEISIAVEDAGPVPCLTPLMAPTAPSTTDAGAVAPLDAGAVAPVETGAGEPADAAAPVPCLRVAAPPSGGPHPQVCLSVAPPSTTDGGKPKPPPQPCLKIAPPRSQ